MDSATVVMKFGGTSVADAERLKRAAQRIVAKREAGHRVVAVLSARGKETDRLIADAHEVSPHPDPREMDMLLSTGERVSCALCAMAINDLGHRAISLTGSQAGIVTDTSHTKARILDVRADRIFAALDEDSIVLVAGFQGVSTARDVTTLGRGGSDTTAVALAAAVGAEVCEIYTDVPGVFSADPRLVPNARKLPILSFEEMLEMSASGAGVLQLRSVEYARNHGVRIHCRSSFDDAPGTVVVSEEETMEQPLITAVTHSLGEARVTLMGVPDTPGVAGRVTTALAQANVNIDMIIQGEPETEGLRADMSFTIPRDDILAARTALDPIASELGMTVATDETMGKVSIVGAGMKTHPGVAAKVFTTLGDNAINIMMISTSPIRISCVVPGDRVPDAVKALHSAFELSGEGTHPPGAAVRGVRVMRVAVVGATGAVGTLLLALLERRGFPADEVVPFASARSAGKQLGDMVVQPLADDTIQGFDVALFSAGGATSREWAPRFAAAGALVVDNSSAWRMDPEVPLVVSEVNPDALDHIGKGIVANPNCTTMAVMLPAKALHDAFGLTAMVCTSFQAAGGAGQKGMDELHAQVDTVREHDLVNDGAAAAASVEPKVHAKALAFNVVPWLGSRGRGRLQRRGDEAAQRVAQDPRHPRPQRRADLRARAGDGRPRHRGARDLRAPGRPRRGDGGAAAPSPTSSSTTSRRRWSGPDATRSPSGACARTCTTTTASTSSWWATTCSRAPRSTPCRSPSCCTRAGSSARRRRRDRQL